MNRHQPTHTQTQSMGKSMLVIFWLILLGALTWGFGNWERQEINPNQNPDSRLTQHQGQKYTEVILNSNRQHHYVVNGHINGKPVTFLLDTGATDVVVPQTLAKKLGLTPGRSHIASTANGQVRVYSTRIDSLQLGAIQLHNVRASINPGMNGKGILLGMSALRDIDFSQHNGQLTLRQSL